jgi:ACR3 family arsenite efflux pump ArsB
MLHPFFSTLIRRPDLVVAHLAGYGSLVHEELSDVGKQFVRHAVAWLLAAVLALLFLVFAGTAVMLGCVDETFHWALVAVPGITLLLAILAFAYARQPMAATRFEALKTQLELDIHAMKAAGEQV